MFENLRPRRGVAQPTDQPDQPTAAQPTAAQPQRRYLLELAFAAGAAVLAIAWLLSRAISASAGATVVNHLVEPFVALGLAAFGGRAVARQRLRWCRSCRRWRAMEWTGERVLHRRPYIQTRKAFTETYNIRGQKTGTSRQRTTARVVRETVDIEQVCRYCGAMRLLRETRDR